MQERRHPSGPEYEKLIKRLVNGIRSRAHVETESIRRNVQVSGLANTPNQLDVVWDVKDAAGNHFRIVFEARSKGRRIEKNAVYAFKGVIEDIQNSNRPVYGVMVTTTGYQSGAQAVADTYGIVILELREPTDKDRSGRVGRIDLAVGVTAVTVRPILLEVVRTYGEWGDAGSDGVSLDDVVVEEGGQLRSLERVLTDGELGGFANPRPVHRVQRVFSPPAQLLRKTMHLADIRMVEADVGEYEGPAVTTTISGVESVAWTVKDALTGAHAWIYHNGNVIHADANAIWNG